MRNVLLPFSYTSHLNSQMFFMSLWHEAYARKFHDILKRSKSKDTGSSWRERVVYFFSHSPSLSLWIFLHFYCHCLFAHFSFKNVCASGTCRTVQVQDFLAVSAFTIFYYVFLQLRMHFSYMYVSLKESAMRKWVHFLFLVDDNKGIFLFHAMRKNC